MRASNWDFESEKYLDCLSVSACLCLCLLGHEKILRGGHHLFVAMPKDIPFKFADS